MPYNVGNVRVLIVDDQETMLKLVDSVLKAMGFKKIFLARNGKEAFEKFNQHDPDIIVTDWLMEPVDGLELTEKIRTDPDSINPYVPIIMMTGFSSKFRVEKARDIGITEFLVKPFRSRDLYNRIVQIVEKPRRFVDAKGYFGPDRRRRLSDGYEGPRRRHGEKEIEAGWSDETSAEDSDILKKLRDEAKAVSG